jgi:hypothetical protein
MSLTDILNKYPKADGYLQTAMGKVSTATSALNDHSVTVTLTSDIAIGSIFLLPLLDIAIADLPPIHELLTHEILWLKMIGKTEKSPTTFDVVCDIVGGRDKAGDKLALHQTGITFQAVHHLFVPESFLLEQARSLSLFMIPAASAGTGATSGTSASVLTLSSACGLDLDDRKWDCTDKWGAQTRTNRLMALTRLWPRKKMLHYAHDITLDYAKLYATCMRLKTSGAKHAETHRDAGLHMYSALHSLAVMKHAPTTSSKNDPAHTFAVGSKFQHALLLDFNCLDHTQISVLDFLEPVLANSATFVKDRYTTSARDILRLALESMETFFEAFAHPAFSGAMQALCKSLRTNTNLWNRYDDAFVLFKTSAMVQGWSEEICTHHKSNQDDTIDLSRGDGAAQLLKALCAQTLADAEAGTGGWTDQLLRHFYANDHGLFHEIKQRPKTAGSKKRERDPDGSPLLEDLDGDGEIPENKSAAAKPAAVKTAAQKTADAAAKAKTTRAKQNCIYHVMQQLGVATTAGPLAKCTAGDKCEFKHQDLSAITKSQAVGCSKVPIPDKGLQEGFKLAVEAKTDWKIFELPAPSPRKKVRFGATA